MKPQTNYEDVTSALLSMGIPDPTTEPLPAPHTHSRTTTPSFQHIQLGRDMQIWALRIRGFSPDQIAAHFKTTRNTVVNAIRRATNHIDLEIPDTMLKLELERLDYLLIKAMDVLETEHHAFNHGKVMYNASTGEPYVDTQPILAAISTVLKIQERRSKFMALDRDPANSSPADDIQSELQTMIDEVNQRAKAAAQTHAPTPTDR